MNLVLDILAILFLAGGCFFSFTGAFGIWRMPDFFTRIHPAGKSDTLGVLLIASGLFMQNIRYGYGWLVGVKLVLVVFFVFFTAPAATHAIIQAAHLDGLRPWRPEGSTEEAKPHA